MNQLVNSELLSFAGRRIPIGMPDGNNIQLAWKDDEVTSLKHLPMPIKYPKGELVAYWVSPWVSRNDAERCFRDHEFFPTLEQVEANLGSLPKTWREALIPLSETVVIRVFHTCLGWNMGLASHRSINWAPLVYLFYPLSP